MKLVGASIAFVVFAAARVAVAQSYGGMSQVLTIGAAEFTAETPNEGSIGPDGYLTAPAGATFSAPLDLPDGASVEKLCLFARDLDGARNVTVYLLAVKLVAAGSGGPSVVFLADVVSVDGEYDRTCTDGSDEFLPYTLTNLTNFDAGGLPDNTVYVISAIVPTSTEGLGLGGVQVTWHRQVSLPPPTPTFGDVPATDAAWIQIEALAASGITAGCGGGDYCPDAALTRRQMAVFLAKALGLHWVD